MKTFDKSSKLEHVAYDIRGPVLDEANRMIAKGEKILQIVRGFSQLVRLLCSIASLRVSQM